MRKPAVAAVSAAVLLSGAGVAAANDWLPIFRAERVARNGDWEMLASERPRGVFSRQLVLGDNLDLDRIEAAYDGGVLRLRVPVAEKAKPRKIEVTSSSESGRTAIEA